MKKKQHFVPITRRALVQRIGRALEKNGERLKANVRPGLAPAIGNHFTVDMKRNSVARTHVELEELGRELGALKPYERVEEEKEPKGRRNR
jgi:hypothetical protein